MRRPDVAMLVLLPFILAACSGKPKSASTESSTSPSETSGQTTQEPSEGRTPVTKLPAGVEGLELTAGGLRVLQGYQFVTSSESTFIILRLRDQRPTGTGGSCRCSSGSGRCSPADQGGIIVCQPDSLCSKCALAVSVGGVSTPIFIY